MTEKVIVTKKKLSLKDALLQNFSFVAIILVCVVFTILEPNFMGYANLTNLLSDSAPLMIMAAGMTPVLILGSIDLSVGSMCSVCNVLVLTLMIRFADSITNPVILALLCFGVTIIIGVCSGIVLGFIHVKFKVPSFIASLAFMSVWSSVALLIANAPIAVPKALRPCIAWYKIHFGPIGLPLILALLLTVGMYFIMTRTSFGKGLYAIGGNERTARISGIKVDQYKIIVFALNGFCAATGAIFLMAKGKSAAPTIGDAFTLMIISAVALGGTSLAGGAGNILKTIIGVFIVAIIKNGMNVVGVNVFWQKIVYGIVILIAIALSVDRSARNKVIK